jgi:hypothetical protein
MPLPAEDVCPNSCANRRDLWKDSSAVSFPAVDLDQGPPMISVSVERIHGVGSSEREANFDF